MGVTLRYPMLAVRLIYIHVLQNPKECSKMGGGRGGKEGRRERVQGGVEGGSYVEAVKDDGVVVMKERLLQQGEERSK